MSKWRKMTIGDFITLQRGHDLTNEEREVGNVPVYGAAGKNGYHNKSLASGPGLIIGRSGGSFGKVYFVKESYWPHNTSLYATDFKENDPRFAFYLLTQMDLSSLNSGSAQPSLNRNYIYPLPIKVPEPSQQRKIAAVLSALDDKIELNNRINAELEQMAKTLYDYWFVQFDFPNAKGKPYKASGGKMVYDEVLKREVPEGWEVKSLYKVANFINGLACQKYRPLKESDPYLAVIKIREMSDGISINTEKARVDIPEKNKIDNGDILFSWSATLGIKIWTEGKGALNQHIFKVTSDHYPKSFYYFEILNYLHHFKMMAELRKTTMGHITLDHLKTSFISVPPIDLIEKLDKKLDIILSKIIISKKQNQQLADLRDWLLPMLMNGQAKVK